MVIDAWINKHQREEFFTDLRALIEGYPSIADCMAREYEMDPTNPKWSSDAGYDRFSPKSPMIVQGLVLIVSHSNLEHFEDMKTLVPYEQSGFMTQGMLTKASSVWGLDPIDLD